jgi:putative ABC transport system permease protein
VLFDRLSRPIYGAIRNGQQIEINGANYRVGGFVEIGPDIVNDGAVVMSDGAWLAANPQDKPLMAVIRLNPGQDVNAAERAIQAQVPDDVQIRTPAEIRERENDFTLGSAPIGILFGVGVLAGFVIGAITCYQTLFNEIMDRLPQYATLRAMGFSDLYLQRVICEQALLLALGGFAMGLVLALGANAYIGGEAALPLRLSLNSTLWTLALTACMSLLAGWIAMRLLASAKPDELY